MSLSKFLKKRKPLLVKLVDELKDDYDYVSILGADVEAKSIVVNKVTTQINEGFDNQCGFVVKLQKGHAFYEYSLNDVSGDIKKLAEKIKNEIVVTKELEALEIDAKVNDDEKLEKSFVRKSDLNKYEIKDYLDFETNLVKEVLNAEKHFLNANVVIMLQNISKVFVSKNKVLDQNFTWVNGIIMGVYRSDEGKMVMTRVGESSYLVKDVFDKLPKDVEKLVDKSYHLSKAKPIEAGMYDIITDPSISGLIAHEAFGHGVEMDQFVKDRAKGKYYVNDYVASPIVNMRDGAASVIPANRNNVCVASYFFDDDGILAKDTQIIKNGILVSGISDLTSASELNTTPTGNGRRETYKRKAYSRMTNTYFEAGNDKLSDMIKSVKHGYMLFETNNGMEDPKSWAIQCVAEYGIEIVDGKLTDNYVSPVVMSGYVPDLLKSITMVSNNAKVIGSGACGKGYKEWVRVSDGGPHLKAKVKLA